jgi:hypothetical protein
MRFRDSDFCFEKHIKLSHGVGSGMFEVLQSHGLPRGFHKTASEFPPEIAEAIANLKPKKNKIYVVIAPMGCGEFWGPNVNGDFFPDKALRHKGEDYGHKTFELFANIFRHHINKDPSKSFGKIIKSCMDDDMGRVVVIAEVDRDLGKEHGASEFIDELDSGVLPEVSMGCKVPYDVCSICGNKAKSPAFYCGHLSGGNMLKIDGETGKIAYAINDFPKFFDLSFVYRGADRSSGTLFKIASGLALSEVGTKISPKVVAEKKTDDVFVKTCSDAASRICDAKKTSIHFFLENNPSFMFAEKKMPSFLLDKLAREDEKDIFGTFWANHVPLRPDEVQYIFLKKLGYDSLATKMYLAGAMIPVPSPTVFPEVCYGYNKKAEDIVSSIFHERTLRQPFLSRRCGGRTVKEAGMISSDESLEVSAKMTALYAVLQSLARDHKKSVLANTIHKNPGFWVGLLGANSLAAQLGSILTPAPVERREIISWGEKESFEKKKSLVDFVKNASRDTIVQKILGTPLEIVLNTIIGSGIAGYSKANEKEIEKSKILKDYPKIDPVSEFIVNNPGFTTAAFLTVATPGGRAVAGKILEKIGSGEKNTVYDRMSVIDILPFDESKDEGYLNELSFQMLSF